MKKPNFLVSAGIVTALVIAIIGVSYSYFTANLSGGETVDTIEVGGGTLKITFNGGSNINVSNVIPSDNAIAVKNFTVVGNNTTDLNMQYDLNLVVNSNSFSSEALKYKLISDATTNGTPAPAITEMSDIDTGAKTYSLGSGTFNGATGGNAIHTYSLELHFPRTESDQNDEQGQTMTAYVSITT